MTLNEGLTDFWQAAQHLPRDTPQGEWLVTDLPAGFDVSIHSKSNAPNPLDIEAWRVILPPLSRISWNGDMLLEITPPQVELGGLAPTLPIGGFLQPSLGGQQALQTAVLDAIPEEADWVADLYCGLGTFAIPLAARGHRVQAIEVYEPAIAALDAAVRRDASNTFRIHVGLRNLDLYPLQGEELKGFDAAIFDPPRAGAGPRQGGWPKAKSKPSWPSVAIPLLGPETPNCSARRAIPRKVQPIDQFPNTAHLELVSVFRSRAL